MAKMQTYPEFARNHARTRLNSLFFSEKIGRAACVVLGILGDIQCHYGIDDDKGGLLQTVFIASYMIFAPMFGYMGDRYSRRCIMAFGVFLWSITTLLGSFMEVSGCIIKTSVACRCVTGR